MCTCLCLLLHASAHACASTQLPCAPRPFLRAGMQARRQAHGRREVVAAQVIQTLWRGTSARLDYTRAVTAIKRLQAAYRGRIARRRFGELQRQQAALTLQAGWRGFVARRVYTTQQQAATTMQNAWRAQLAKRAIRKFKTDAREAGWWRCRRGLPAA